MSRKKKVHFTSLLAFSAIFLSAAIPIKVASAGEPIRHGVSASTYTIGIQNNVQLAASTETDELGTYQEDLTAFGKSANLTSIATTPSRQDAQRATARLPHVTVNGAAHRALLDLHEVAVVDDLGTYNDDLSEFGTGFGVRLEVASREVGRETPAREHPSRFDRAGIPADVKMEVEGDMLGTYMEDLSAFGRSARISAAEGAQPTTSTPEYAVLEPRRTVDLDALRAWVRSPEFSGRDELGTYMEDWTRVSVAANSVPAGQAPAARFDIEALFNPRQDGQIKEALIAGSGRLE